METDRMKRLSDAWFGECLPFLSGEMRDALREFVKRMRDAEGGNLLEIVLYGSMARGDFGERSDADLFVVLRGGNRKIKEGCVSAVASCMDSTASGSLVLFSPFVETLSSLGCETGGIAHWWLDPIFESIRRDGIILYEDDGGAGLDALPNGPEERKTSIVAGRFLQRAKRDAEAAVSCLDRSRRASVDLAFRSARHSLRALLRHFGVGKARKYNFGAESALFREHFVPKYFPFDMWVFLRDLQTVRARAVYSLSDEISFGEALYFTARSGKFAEDVKKLIDKGSEG